MHCFNGELGVDISEHAVSIQTAKQALVQTLGEILSFLLPPYDDISYFNLRSVRQQDLIPIYGQERIHKFFRSKYIPRFYKRRVAKRIFSRFGKSAFIVPVYVTPQKEEMTVSLPQLNGLDFEKHLFYLVSNLISVEESDDTN